MAQRKCAASMSLKNTGQIVDCALRLIKPD
jgi:hypothetical protein